MLYFNQMHGIVTVWRLWNCTHSQSGNKVLFDSFSFKKKNVRPARAIEGAWRPTGRG